MPRPCSVSCTPDNQFRNRPDFVAVHESALAEGQNGAFEPNPTFASSRRTVLLERLSAQDGAGALSWTSEVGCEALVSGIMRRYSAKTRSTPTFCTTSRRIICVSLGFRWGVGSN